MSADSPKYHQIPKTKPDPHLVTPQEVTDPSILDSVAGFISDVVPASYTAPYDITDQIQWAHFEQLDIDELSFISDNNYDKYLPPPLILVVGYSTGIQVWCVAANGEASEIISWRHGSTKVLKMLPSPHKINGDNKDLFLTKRPLMALCDSSSPGPAYCSLSFLSIKTGEQVKVIKFKNTIMDVHANKRSVVVSFSERIAVFDAFTLDDRCTVTTCYASPGIYVNPIALGYRWLAYADKTLTSSKKSNGGCDNEGVPSYKATMIQCAKSLSKGIKDFGETVANSLTGTSSFKPGVVCPGSPQSGGLGDGCQKGVVTILDIESEQLQTEERTPLAAVIAHFIAHNEALVALEFDPSGMLLLTADRRGHDFHVFRICSHPFGSLLASVHHLYILHRGDTSSKVQDMCFSPDSRWVTVSTLRGTTHVFPITSYGGNVGVRTHTTEHVVNKMSRFHRSAGLTGEERSNSPVSGMESNSGNMSPYLNPRYPPYPHPTIIHPLAQIRQPVTTQNSAGAQRSSSTRPRLSSSSEDSVSLRIAACFAAPRAYMDNLKMQESSGRKVNAVESLFIMGSHGSLIQYDLEPQPIQSVLKEKVSDDTPIELKTLPKAQWILQRPPNAIDVPLPIKEKYLCYFLPCESGRKRPNSEQNDDHWLSQVEIVTHAGPHRRLWMGPQFTFKTYTTMTGCPFSIANVQQIDIGRTKPVNMPVTHDAVFIECGSANSRELSPPMNTYPATFEEIGGLGDLQLREDLADAMLESPGNKESGGRCVIVSMKPQATPIAKVVNPLGTVVTIKTDDQETEKEQCEEVIVHENCDESLFRRIVAPKPILFSEGKQRSCTTDTMIVRSLDNTTELAVRILNNEKDSAPNKKHIIEKKYNKTKNRNSEEREIENTDDVDSFDNLNFDENINNSILKESTTVETIDELLPTNYSDDCDFPYLESKNDIECKTEMFEDATDCYNDLLFIKDCTSNKDNFDNYKSEEKSVTVKPRKPKTKLGVRIPNKNFSSKNEVEPSEPLIPKRSWSSVAALKPKDKINESEKENCELLDLTSDDKTIKKSYNSNIKNVKLIHIETPTDEDAAIEIVEPVPQYRRNSWFSNVLDKSSDEEKNIDISPIETTESDDSGKLQENQPTEDFISQSVIQTITKTTKKKSKKKRK